MNFELSRVEGADSYVLEVDCLDCCESGKWCSELGRSSVLENLKEPRYSFNFNGDHRGRWRVWATAGFRESEKSPWRDFSFERLASPGPPGDGAVYTMPVTLSTAPPQFPESARKDTVRGTVVLNVMVGADGNAQDATIKQSVPEDLDQAAVAAVRKWKFKPATRDGKPVAYLSTVTVSFNLL